MRSTLNWQRRPDIDGLRAVAVLSVIFYHAKFYWFQGGYVGVDVFFVISGFLITGLILAERAADQFSLLSFYERRIRRILPAFFVVLLVTIPIACLILLPDRLKDFSQSIVASSLFIANKFFNLKSSYFSTGMDWRPLLHTWSLSIEEQFYLAYPLFLLVFSRYGRIALSLTLMLFAGWSLNIMIDAASVGRGHDGFYWLTARIWELLVGGVAALFIEKFPKSRLINEGFAWVGVLMIGSAVFLFSKKMPFPSLYTLIPVLGAGCLIVAHSSETTVSRCLSHPVMVGIGLVSYSAYLWHQPVFAFLFYRFPFLPAWWIRLGACVFVFVLAYLTWRWVETPCRKRDFLSRGQLFSGAFLLLLSFVSLGVYGHKMNGFYTTWQASAPKRTVEMYHLLRTPQQSLPMQACQFSLADFSQQGQARFDDCAKKYGPAYVVLGDSYALDLWKASTRDSSFPFVVSMAKVACRPRGLLKERCQYQQFLPWLKQHASEVKGVVYDQGSRYYLLNKRGVIQSSDAQFKKFQDLPIAQRISGVLLAEDKINGVYQLLKKVSEVTPVLWFGPRLFPAISYQDFIRHGCRYPYRLRPGHRALFKQIEQAIQQRIANNPQLTFLSQTDSFQFQYPNDLLSCQTRYWDLHGHFRSQGEERFGHRFSVLRYFSQWLLEKPRKS